MLTKAAIAPAALLFGGISFYILSRKQQARRSAKRAPWGALFRYRLLGSAIELFQIFLFAQHDHFALGPDVLKCAG